VLLTSWVNCIKFGIFLRSSQSSSLHKLPLPSLSLPFTLISSSALCWGISFQTAMNYNTCPSMNTYVIGWFSFYSFNIIVCECTVGGDPRGWWSKRKSNPQPPCSVHQNWHASLKCSTPTIFPYVCKPPKTLHRTKPIASSKYGDAEQKTVNVDTLERESWTCGQEFKKEQSRNTDHSNTALSKIISPFKR
jgi:hypothetical protein